MIDKLLTMTDSRGNVFGVGSTLVSNEVPEVGIVGEVICNSINKGVAKLEFKIKTEGSLNEWFITQDDLTKSHWVIKT
jgi:hypothetical protein